MIMARNIQVLVWGTEFAISDDVSIDLEYKYLGWSNTGNTGHSFGASANWHF